MNDVNLTAERRHEIRYDVQQYFIPEMVECVKDGYLPFIALFPSAQWYSNLRMDYDIEELKAAKVWDSFEKIEIDEDNMIILYTFPQPEEVPEALYGAVLLNHSTNDLKYFTLEASFEKIEIDEDNMIILYTFPQPEEVPEALYGAVLLNHSTNDLKYFTLEASYEDKWAVCSKDTSMHSCLDFWDSADKEKFIQWVMGRLHR